MNDFTKEELQIIKKSIDELIFSKFYAEDTQDIYKKTQSMIDNYCDHDGEKDIDIPAERCKKCERILY